MSNSPDQFPDLHPLAERPITINWAEDMETGEAIVSQAWAYVGPDTSLVLDRPSVSGQKTSAWVKAGTLDAQYSITNKIVTNSIPPKTLVAVKLLHIRDAPR
jgi:hypothetical protein